MGLSVHFSKDTETVCEELASKTGLGRTGESDPSHGMEQKGGRRREVVQGKVQTNTGTTGSQTGGRRLEGEGFGY